MSWGGWTYPEIQDESTEFNLIDYVETHEINSIEEFEAVIDYYVEGTTELSAKNNITNVVSEDTQFDIGIDYESELVYVTVINTASVTATGVSNSASRDYYNAGGLKIFTVTVSGSFSYTSNSCSVLSNSGSYSKPFYSSWTSTPSYTSGNITTTKAYAKTSGVATNNGSSMSYSLTLTCDTSGNFSSY